MDKTVMKFETYLDKTISFSNWKYCEYIKEWVTVYSTDYGLYCDKPRIGRIIKYNIHSGVLLPRFDVQIYTNPNKILNKDALIEAGILKNIPGSLLETNLTLNGYKL